MECIEISPNPVYELSIKNTAEPQVDSTTHIYSEIKPTLNSSKDTEWVANPTYGCSTPGIDDQSTIKIYDDINMQYSKISQIDKCPAYEQPPVLPSSRQTSRQ